MTVVHQYQARGSKSPVDESRPCRRCGGAVKRGRHTGASPYCRDCRATIAKDLAYLGRLNAADRADRLKWVNVKVIPE